MRLCFILGAFLFASGCSSAPSATSGETAPARVSEPRSAGTVATVSQADSSGSFTGLVPVADDFDNGTSRFGGASTQGCVGWGGQCSATGGSRERRMNLRFAIPALPTCATITSATLTFHHTGCNTCQNGGTMTLSRIGASWTESTAGGSCAGPSDTSVPAVTSVVQTATTTAGGLAPGANGTFAFNVASDVQAWVNGTTNNGWQLGFSSSPISVTCGGSAGNWSCASSGGCGANKKTVATREDTTNTPKLDVFYTLSDAKCDDGRPCTEDACAGGGCTHTANNALTCSDGKACTTDACSGGNCVSTPVDAACDDRQVCTTDTCNPASASANAAGCVYTNNTNTCTDSAACTQNDKCVNGTCVGTPNNALCDDANNCTADTCTATGCQNTITMPGCQTCTTDAQCPAGKYCNGLTCIPTAANGTSCTIAGHCATGNCVDGVCCDKACSGQCEACNVQGSIGVCKPISGTPVPPRAACATDGSVCAGTCNGTVTATCSYPSTTTRCRAPSCTANVATVAAACNGTGKCPALQTQACAPFVCGPSQCVAMCTTNAECQAGRYCAGGMCIPLVEQGKACTADGQCKTGICVDGFCCDARCNQQCEACDVTGSEGTCKAVPSGDPHKNRPACVTDGTACDGRCDGTTRDSCVYPGPGVQCSAPSCTVGIAVVASYCQGTGKCPTAERLNCGNDCVGDLCGSDCTTDAVCSNGEFCQAGKCAKRHRNGEACNAPGECGSSYCVDGVCCDRACNGQCEACDVPPSPGTCTAAKGPPHGVRPACASVDPECAGTCDGVKGDGCTYPGVATVCSAASCATGVAKLARTCAGDGSCAPLQEQLCAPQVCSGTRCGGGCATDANCGAGKFCSGGVCVASLLPGSPCGADTQCATGFCTDGVCCDKECGAQCQACNDPSNVGRCVPVTGRPHGGRAPCIGTASCAGQCDGKAVDSCVLPTAQTPCGQAVCAEGVAHEAPTCNGAGTCIAGDDTDCYPFTCGTDQKTCKSNCATTADCATRLRCVNGGCVPGPDAGAPPGTDGSAGQGGAGSSVDGSAPAGGRRGAGGSAGRSGSPGAGGSAGVPIAMDGGLVVVDAGVDAGPRPPKKSSDSGSCGCRLSEDTAPESSALGALAVALVALGRRRTKSRVLGRRSI